jgi:hypothetical protein
MELRRVCRLYGCDQSCARMLGSFMPSSEDCGRSISKAVGRTDLQGIPFLTETSRGSLRSRGSC